MRTTMRSSVTDRIEDAGRRASEAAYDKSQQYYHDSRDMATGFAHQLEDYVREQPIRSILMAVGIVCLTTAFCIRR